MGYLASVLPGWLEAPPPESPSDLSQPPLVCRPRHMERTQVRLPGRVHNEGNDDRFALELRWRGHGRHHEDLRLQGNLYRRIRIGGRGGIDLNTPAARRRTSRGAILCGQDGKRYAEEQSNGDGFHGCRLKCRARGASPRSREVPFSRGVTLTLAPTCNARQPAGETGPLALARSAALRNSLTTG